MTLPRYDTPKQLDDRLKSMRARLLRALEEDSQTFKGFIPAAKWAQGDLWEPSRRPVKLEDSKGKAMKPARTNAISDPTGAQVARLRNGVPEINQLQARRRKDFDRAIDKFEKSIRELESATGLLEKLMGDRKPRNEEESQHQEIEDYNADLQARTDHPEVPRRYLRRAEENQAKEKATGGGYGRS